MNDAGREITILVSTHKITLREYRRLLQPGHDMELRIPGIFALEEWTDTERRSCKWSAGYRNDTTIVFWLHPIG